ncbi:MAG: hypothetical protein KME55_29715 [Nostoc indistinguendum CM1-VF10]|nr:hypothetical protein [Nostoc indistinguendum CM1-VF10]
MCQFIEERLPIPDWVNHTQYLQDIYLKVAPNYTGQVTVPVLYDKQSQKIINNESRQIMRIFDVEFGELATQKIDLYPCAPQHKIAQTDDAIYRAFCSSYLMF